MPVWFKTSQWHEMFFRDLEVVGLNTRLGRTWGCIVLLSKLDLNQKYYNSYSASHDN